VEAVVGVLDHLGNAQRHAVDGPGQALVELGHGVAARLVDLADDRLRRLEEVTHRAALTQELGIHRQAEALARAHTRGRLEAR
jgi:hypothetical protein